MLLGFSPSVSAKILQLKLFLSSGDVERGKFLLLELLKEHPMFTSFIFVSLEEDGINTENHKESYKDRLELIRNFFIELKDDDLLSSPSVVLAKIRLLKERGRMNDAYNILKSWLDTYKTSSEVLRAEYIKLLIFFR